MWWILGAAPMNQQFRIRGTNYAGKVVGYFTTVQDNKNGVMEYTTHAVLDLGDYGFFDTTHSVYTRFTLCPVGKLEAV